MKNRKHKIRIEARKKNAGVEPADAQSYGDESGPRRWLELRNDPPDQRRYLMKPVIRKKVTG
jgi:hypothetical protein